MSACYAVVVSNDHAEIEICETYAGIQSALGRAWHLAAGRVSDSRTINASPEEEKMDDGSIRWVLLHSHTHFVGVFYLRIETSLKSRNDRLDAVKPLPVAKPGLVFLNAPAPVDPPFVLDDPAEGSLPAGWFYDGEIARMVHLEDSAEDIKNPVSELTEDQMWALAFARISKRPRYNIVLNKFGYFHWAALHELKNRTPIGLQIRDAELGWLADRRSQIIDSYH